MFFSQKLNQRVMVLLFALALVTILSGCSSYREGVWTEPVGGPGEKGHEKIEIEPGQSATVFKNDGQKVAGEIIRLDDEGLVIGKPGNYGLEEVRVQYADVDWIRIEDVGSGCVVFDILATACVTLILLAGLAVRGSSLG